MPLLGPAALLLSFEIAPEAIAEHDDWHTHEHLPERLGIPGFLRGSRYTAVRGEPRYVVLYEVASLETLTSAAYLQRLNHPSPWTARVMPHYRGMTRGLCAVLASFGAGLGGLVHVLRLAAASDAALQRWLVDEALPGLPAQRGVSGAHLLHGAAAAPMTGEQRIRGADAGVDLALLLMGYAEEPLLEAAQAVLGALQRESPGAAIGGGLYRLDATLSCADVGG